jgi:potassium uptake TrkH family protein
MIILDLRNRYANTGFMEILGKIINKLFFVLTLGLFILSVYDIGYTSPVDMETLYNNSIFKIFFPITSFLYLVRSVLFTDHRMSWKVFITNTLLGVLLILLFLFRVILGGNVFFYPVFHNFTLFHFFAFALFILEVSRLKIEAAMRYFNPAQMFMVSFALIILSGTFLLLMPQSTISPISFTDAIFTSTSAVCVTGLTVVDTATRFTPLGRLIILGLIQVGGIGVMTITSFFGFFFKETSSFREQIMLRDYLSEDSFNGILKTLIKVILIVFSIEIVGAGLIFYSMYLHGMGASYDNIRFAVFHSVSAFCNAGFSTMTDNLYDIQIRDNYFMHYTIANLIVFGGIGFPVFLNLYSYIKDQIVRLWEYFRHHKPFIHRVGMITFNTKIVLITTFLLLLFGTVMFYFLEAGSTQSGINTQGRIAMSYFLSVTPRTAGFNTVNMEMLTKPALLIIIFLMWVGASPVSTGGGIKTSTFTIAFLNVVRIIRGKNHIETMQREIHEYSVNKAFSIIMVSLFLIATGTFVIYLMDGEKGLLRIVFECFSAFGTVGLSINLTSFLTAGSKWVLIALMFMGRMGMMTLLLSMSPSAKKSVAYRYPKENIIIT